MYISANSKTSIFTEPRNKCQTLFLITSIPLAITLNIASFLNEHPLQPQQEYDQTYLVQDWIQ
jgi:hypothetical protein